MIYKAIIFLPFLSFLILGINVILRSATTRGSRKTNNILLYLSTAIIGISLILSCYGLYSLDTPITVHLANWIKVAGIKANFNLYIDKLSLMLVILTSLISFLVHIYSISYMNADKSKVKFFAYLDLFTFLMFYFVSNNNLLQMFIAWEGLAFVSYLLIGFNSEKPQAVISSTKAFIVNRISDVLFMFCLAIVYTTNFKSFDINYIVENINYISTSELNIIAWLLFGAAIIKSAQIGFQTWIADAMEAPTPASALIHSSTLVSAGIILLIRTQDIIQASDISYYIALFGLISSVIAGLIAATQTDLKKILAYSTSSQLGFMIFACGIGAYTAAAFHLITHALFKSLLFMNAGDIIQQNNGEHNIYKQKLSKNSIKFLYVTMWGGTLALMGVPPFNGFFSKESIFVEGLFRSNLGFIALNITLVTAIYSSRLMFVLFNKDDKISRKKYKIAKCISFPLAILTSFTLVSSFLVILFPENHSNNILLTVALTIFSLSLILFGSRLTYLYTIKKDKSLIKISSKLIWISQILKQSLYLDKIYSIIFVKPILFLAKLSFMFENIYTDRFIDEPAQKVLKIIKTSQKTKQSFVSFNTGIFVLFVIILLGFYIMLIWFEPQSVIARSEATWRSQKISQNYNTGSRVVARDNKIDINEITTARKTDSSRNDSITLNSEDFEK